MNNLPSFPTWNVQDPSKIQVYMSCPRRYFYEYVLGWRAERPSNHLVFGSAWHIAMETLLLEGNSAESCLRAYNGFLSKYRETFGSPNDELYSPKTPSNVLRALPQYCQRWADDDFEVLHTEISGVAAIAPDKIVHFKMDTICHGREGYFSLEHKTSSRFSTTWAAQWRQKLQVGMYTHALFCLFPEEDVYGVKINGAFFTDPPKIKRDGTPYAKERDNEFHRVPVRRNLASMQSWLNEINFWYDRIQHDFDLLSNTNDGDGDLLAFPRNTESCTSYNNPCPFLDYCSVWNNPLQHADVPPLGFKIEHWDPRERVTDHAKEIKI